MENVDLEDLEDQVEVEVEDLEDEVGEEAVEEVEEVEEVEVEEEGEEEETVQEEGQAGAEVEAVVGVEEPSEDVEADHTDQGHGEDEIWQLLTIQLHLLYISFPYCYFLLF